MKNFWVNCIFILLDAYLTLVKKEYIGIEVISKEESLLETGERVLF